MTRHVLLNNIDHHNLKVITRHAPAYGDSVNSVLTFPTEFADIQREYPILFQKNRETGEYQSIALLGFARDENLFLNEPAWNASYVPCILARGPFLIGFQENDVNGDVVSKPVIHVDMDDPRISESEGEAVFLEHGGNTPYLERVATILRAIHEGLAVSKAMFAAFEAFDLLEAVNIDVEIHEEEVYSLTQFYTVSRERLAALTGDQLAQLNQAGFLRGAFLAEASLANIHKMIEMKHRRRRA